MKKTIEHEMAEAEKKAWDSLARYKFWMFGYWAAIWVHLNRISGFKRPNPWKQIVVHANDVRDNDFQEIRACRKCGCTETDCSDCIERTGSPCYWVEKDLCSACVPKIKKAKKARIA